MDNQQLEWGISTLGCGELSLAEAATLADRYEIKYLELRLLSGLLNLPAAMRGPANRQAMADLTAAGRILVLGSSFGLTDVSEKGRQSLIELGELADQYGVPYLRCFGGFGADEALTKERIDHVHANLCWWRACGFSARLALETHDGFSAAARCAELFAALGEALPVIWDVHHTLLQKESLEQSYRLIGKQLIDVHVKDDDGELNTLPGAGILPIPELLALLRRENVRVPVTFEYERHWQKHLPEMSIALDALRKHWR